MVGADNGLGNGQDFLQKGLGLVQPAQLAVQRGHIVQALSYKRMVRAVLLAPNVQGALIVLFGLVEFALVVTQVGQVVERLAKELFGPVIRPLLIQPEALLVERLPLLVRSHVPLHTQPSVDPTELGGLL